MKPLTNRLLTSLTLLAILAIPAWGQEIVGLNVPSDVCAGASTTISFGYRQQNTIVVQSQSASLGHSERIFLPDGKPCNGTCAYRSPVTFTSFVPGATVTSANDIKYVRLNIEHSYLGDIYIGITCPNGNSASLMKYSGSGSSSCRSSIPSNHIGWVGNNHAYENTYLGNANDYTSGYSTACDSTAYGNEPGVGWNYCWSNSTDYQYASGEGYIYTYGNQHGGKADSSNVALGRQFYHPDQHFSSLIGCPLNGTWEIVVIDGFSGDNDYIFEWELALDASLIPPVNCYPQAYLVAGPWVTRVNDSVFTLNAPSTIPNDTSIHYTFRIVSSCGDTIDTTATIRFHPSPIIEQHAEGCNRYVLNGTVYTSDTTLVDNTLTAAGCPRQSTLHITIHNSYLTHIYDTIVENMLPHTYGGTTFTGGGTFQTLFTSQYGCDSTVIYHLTVLPNTTFITDTTLCSNQIPFLWNGRSYLQSTHDTLRLTSSQGTDSTLILHLTVNPARDSIVIIEIVENHLPALFDGNLYTSDTTFTHHLTTTLGCDSNLYFSLTIHPNQHFNHSLSICDNLLPYSWHGLTFTHADTVTLTLPDQHGADSILHLHLQVNPTHDTTITDTTCDNTPYSMAGQTLDRTGNYTFNLTTTAACDSIIHLDLTVQPSHKTQIHDTICNKSLYHFGDNSYSQSGTYTYTYTNAYGCDSITTLHLNILAGNLEAVIKATPEIVPAAHPEVSLYDISHYSSSRQWIIDHRTYKERDLVIPIPNSIDSLPVILVAYSVEGCTDTARATVRVDRAVVTIPNAFTPDQSENRTWKPFLHQVIELEIWIYNRQGLLVNHLQGIDAEWDGTTTAGTTCPQAAYIYTMHYRTETRPDRKQIATGTILLIR